MGGDGAGNPVYCNVHGEATNGKMDIAGIGEVRKRRVAMEGTRLVPAWFLMLMSPLPLHAKRADLVHALLVGVDECLHIGDIRGGQRDSLVTRYTGGIFAADRRPFAGQIGVSG